MCRESGAGRSTEGKEEHRGLHSGATSTQAGRKLPGQQSQPESGSWRRGEGRVQRAEVCQQN